MASSRVAAMPMETFNSATLTGNYDLAHTGLPAACFLLKIVNNSDTDVTVSYDGVDGHDFVRNDNKLEINFQTNSQPHGHVNLLSQGTRIYLAGVAGTGNIYIIGYYAV